MQIIGIDISKKGLTVFCNARSTNKRFNNTPCGVEALCRVGKREKVHVVMEASGPYYLGLASCLHAQGMPVSVVNPLVIRRYGQIKLTRTKTDAKDTALIAQYGRNQQPELWTPPSGVCQALRQLGSLREGLLRQAFAVGKYQEPFNEKKAIAAYQITMPSVQSVNALIQSRTCTIALLSVRFRFNLNQIRPHAFSLHCRTRIHQ